MYKLGKYNVIVHDSGELGESPWEPFLQAHAESVNVFIKLFNQSDGLSDGLILSVNIKSAFLTRELMTETKLSFSKILLRDFFDDLGEVGADSTEHFNNSVVIAGSDAGCCKDLLTETGVTDS